MAIRAVGRSAIVLLCLTAAACDNDSPAPTQAPSPPPDIARYVTGEAAAALGSNGLFQDLEPPRRERPMVSRQRARELALGYANTYRQFFEPIWEEEHGAAIDVTALRAAPRVYYAESPYGAFPEGPYHPAYRRGYGPYYVVTLTDGDEPVIMVAVSAFNTDVGLDERGQVQQPAVGGNEFMSIAVPRDPQGYRPLSPEHAVARIGRMTGARANGPPEFLLRARWHPSLALWRVPLDRPVRVRAGSAPNRLYADTLYLDGHGRSFVPSADQPRELVRNVVVGPPWGLKAPPKMPARIPVAPGRATRFEEVTVEPE